MFKLFGGPSLFDLVVIILVLAVIAIAWRSLIPVPSWSLARRSPNRGFRPRARTGVLPIGLCLALAACAGAPQLQTPAQLAFATRGTLIAALGLANAYADLPVCVAGGSPVCSDPPTVDRINSAAVSAGALVNVAVATVQAKTSSAAEIDQAIAAAAQAVTALQALIPASTPRPAASLDGAVRLALSGPS